MSPVTLHFSWPYEGSHVIATGTFDNWSQSIALQKPSPETPFEGSTSIEDSIEEVLYKFVVDGVWMYDMGKENVSDGMGGWNNVVRVKELVEARDREMSKQAETESATEMTSEDLANEVRLDVTESPVEEGAEEKAGQRTEAGEIARDDTSSGVEPPSPTELSESIRKDTRSDSGVDIRGRPGGLHMSPCDDHQTAAPEPCVADEDSGIFVSAQPILPKAEYIAGHNNANVNNSTSDDTLPSFINISAPAPSTPTNENTEHESPNLTPHIPSVTSRSLNLAPPTPPHTNIDSDASSALSSITSDADASSAFDDLDSLVDSESEEEEEEVQEEDEQVRPFRERGAGYGSFPRRKEEVDTKRSWLWFFCSIL
ncbi:hypothetical protein HDV00_011377 [Rhizophlyctis rosea]|nr:hypothetical protein HDV00_011377 [Rhizophlyctis rosea]